MDIILDFEQGQDRIDVSALGITAADMNTAMVYDIIGGNTYLKDLPSGLTVQLTGEHQLTANDFIFA
jgi:hypothetical protein